MTKVSKPLFKNLIQVGMVVSNLKKSMQKYIYGYGIGPMYVLKFAPNNVSDMHLHGKRKDYSMNLGVCPIGDIRFELIEPISESIYSEYYKKFGESIIHHLKLGVDNYFDALEYLRSIGIKVIQSGHQLGDYGKNMYTYLGTSVSLGFIIEIVNITSDFIKPKPDYWFPDSKEEVPQPLFKRLSKIGIVVKNLKEKVKTYQDVYGNGPWYFKRYSSKNLDNMHIHGKRKDYSMDIAFYTLGNVEFKLIEPLDSSIYSKFYNRYGDGVIHHLTMEVDNYKNTLEYLKSKDIKVIQSGTYLGNIEYSYLSTDRDISFIVELINSKDKKKIRFCP